MTRTRKQEDTNTFNAIHRFARISAQKARIVMDVIRGNPVEDALTKLRFIQRRASPMISKVLRSALANATQKAGLQGDDLVVWRAFVDDGPMWKRWKPRAQGRAYPRLRRSCHLSIVLKQAEKEAKSPDLKSPRAKGDRAEGKAAAGGGADSGSRKDKRG
jgi:large subunit ribosomal protein L22